jgi:hypothetical protein
VNTTYDLRGTVNKTMAFTLDWDTVQKLATMYDADLIMY